MDLISYHEYGIRAAESCKQSAIDEVFSLPLIDAISAATSMKDDSVIDAVIAWNGFDENLDRALEIIHSAAYMQAHFHLNDLIMIEREESKRIARFYVDDFPVYPNTVKDLQPAPIITMVEVLTESIQASNAPSAAATSRLQSVTS
jgi:hypothetical protein